jgi:type IV pilus assembly protein PilC
MHPRDKARLFHDLGQLIHGGVPLTRALENLATHTRGKCAAVLRGLRASLSNGASIAEAFAAQQPTISALEAGIFAASDRAGCLDKGLTQAAEYYDAIADAQSRMWSKSAYPIFVLHFAALASAVPGYFKGEGLDQILTSFGIYVSVIWAIILGGLALVRLLLRVAERSATLDGVLRILPPIGKLRRSFALSRFCSAYNMQLEAGVNVFASLEAAACASASATISSAITRALPDVRTGSQVAAALEKTGAFPRPMLRALLVGEDSGKLDQQLRRLTEEYRTTSIKRLDTIADWIPKLVYLGILIYIGREIIGYYSGYLNQVESLTMPEP